MARAPRDYKSEYARRVAGVPRGERAIARGHPGRGQPSKSELRQRGLGPPSPPGFRPPQRVAPPREIPPQIRVGQVVPLPAPTMAEIRDGLRSMPARTVRIAAHASKDFQSHHPGRRDRHVGWWTSARITRRLLIRIADAASSPNDFLRRLPGGSIFTRGRAPLQINLEAVPDA